MAAPAEGAPIAGAAAGASTSTAGARSRADVRKVVDDWIQALPWANIAFNGPSPMRFRRSAEIQVLLSSEKPLDELIRQVAAPGNREGAQVQVSSHMRANLTGRGFDIVAIRPEEQAVGKAGTTEWRWDVSPTTDEPRGLLHLTLTALVSVDGSAIPVAVRTFDRWVDVEVTWTQRASSFVENNWQWLWAAVLVPLAAAVWRRIMVRRGRPPRSGEVPAAST